MEYYHLKYKLIRVLFILWYLQNQKLNTESTDLFIRLLGKLKIINYNNPFLKLFVFKHYQKLEEFNLR